MTGIKRGRIRKGGSDNEIKLGPARNLVRDAPVRCVPGQRCNRNHYPKTHPYVLIQNAVDKHDSRKIPISLLFPNPCYFHIYKIGRDGVATEYLHGRQSCQHLVASLCVRSTGQLSHAFRLTTLSAAAETVSFIVHTMQAEIDGAIDDLTVRALERIASKEFANRFP